MKPTRRLALSTERLAELTTDELHAVAAADAPPTQQCQLTQLYTECLLFTCDLTRAECN
jgi:hypothetical protein